MTGLIGHDQTGSLGMGSSFCVPCVVLGKAAQVKKEKKTTCVLILLTVFHKLREMSGF